MLKQIIQQPKPEASERLKTTLLFPETKLPSPDI